LTGRREVVGLNSSPVQSVRNTTTITTTTTSTTTTTTTKIKGVVGICLRGMFKYSLRQNVWYAFHGRSPRGFVVISSGEKSAAVFIKAFRHATTTTTTTRFGDRSFAVAGPRL